MNRALKINTYHRNHEYSKWQVFRKTRGRCIYCELEFSDIHDPRFTLEHLIPISRGGHDDLSNVFPCCKKCNTSRGSMELNKWRLLLIEKRNTYKGIYHITNRIDKIIARLALIFDE